MRKFNYFSAVLSLFLLVPASIIWAQVTKTLHGTVRYQSGMSESKLSTPNGDVTIILPQSLTGAVITGTVSTQPAGKTEKEKRKNLDALLKMVVNLDGQHIPLSASPANFDWLTHQDRSVRTPVELLNVSAVKVAELSLPPVLSMPVKDNRGAAPRLTTPSNMLVKGDALNVYTDQQFSPGEKFVLTDSKGQQFTLKPVCLSSQQAVLTIPDAVVPGDCTIREEIWNQPITGYNLTLAEFKLIDIDLTSPNTNLRKGETSSVTVTVKTKENLSKPDSDEFMLFRVDLRNITPGVVDMAGGNMQAVRFPLNENKQNPAAWQITRTITGITPGPFSVSATLHEDYAIANDPFRPQLDVLKTPGAFNTWADALKKDLSRFATGSNDDEIGQALKSNTQRTIDNMPVCSSPEQLDECKSVAYSLIRPLNIPKGAASTWISSYEAFKAASTRFTEKEPAPVEYPTYLNGLDFMQRISYRSNDPVLAKDVSDVRNLVHTMEETGETEEKRNQLNEALGSLITRTDHKLLSATTLKEIGNQAELFVSTGLLNKRIKDGVDPFQSMVGYLDPVRKVLVIEPEYRQRALNALNGVQQADGSYQIQTLTTALTTVTYSIRVLASPPVPVFDEHEWLVEYLTEKTKKNPKAGTVITVYKDTAGTWYRFFKDAQCAGWGGEEPEERSSDCSEEIEYKWKDDGSREDKKTGKYVKIHWQPIKQCLKGEKFCSEVLQIWRIKYTYADKDCTELRKVEPDWEFGCK